MHSDSSKGTIQKILTTPPPAYSHPEAVKIAKSHYGIEGTVQPLVSERDQNFKLGVPDGSSFTLKISNREERFEAIDFQNRALLHIAGRDSSLPLPRVIPTLDGQLHSRIKHAGHTHFVRVLSWLEGSVLHDTTASPKLAGRLGRFLASLGVALQGFEHPGSNLPLLWDMKRAASLSDLLGYIEDASLRDLIARTLENFVTKVKPVLDELRSQVIHNDMNPGNILMDKAQPERISGIIDFGDMTRSPLIIDLAVAASYQLSKGDDPLQAVLPMISGYHAVQELQDTEMELLTDLIRTRLVTSLLIGSYRSMLFPENREYLLISHRSAMNFLLKLERMPADVALARIRKACLSS